MCAGPEVQLCPSGCQAQDRPSSLPMAPLPPVPLGCTPLLCVVPHSAALDTSSEVCILCVCFCPGLGVPRGQLFFLFLSEVPSRGPGVEEEPGEPSSLQCRHTCVPLVQTFWNPSAQKGKEGGEEGAEAGRGGLRMTHEGNGICDRVYGCPGWLAWHPLPRMERGPWEEVPKESVSGRRMMGSIWGC